MRTIIAMLMLVMMPDVVAAAQQNPSKRLSAPASATCKFDDGKAINTDYHSPRMIGRKIFGGIVPYEQVWKTGANEATTLVTDTDLSIGDKDIPAGRYTLFTIPAADRWTLIISKKTGEGSTTYSESEDLLRVNMRVSKIPTAMENFTIGYQKKDRACSLTLAWEHTSATIDLVEKKLCWPTTSPLTYSCPDQ